MEVATTIRPLEYDREEIKHQRSFSRAPNNSICTSLVCFGSYHVWLLEEVLISFVWLIAKGVLYLGLNIYNLCV